MKFKIEKIHCQRRAPGEMQLISILNTNGEEYDSYTRVYHYPAKMSVILKAPFSEEFDEFRVGDVVELEIKVKYGT